MASSTVEYSQSDLPTMQIGLDAFGRTVANVQEYREAYVSLVVISSVKNIFRSLFYARISIFFSGTVIDSPNVISGL